MAVMFDELAVDLPGRTEAITLGVTSGYDFFGGDAVYVEGFARDTACANSLRALTDREVVKHVGDVDGFDDWWEGILGQLYLVADDLLVCIDEAQAIDVDFSAMSFDVETFYDCWASPNTSPSTPPRTRWRPRPTRSRSTSGRSTPGRRTR